MYKGAGILFIKKEEKQYFVSLGKRTVSPQKGYWSIPGGRMSVKDDCDFWKCAVRETKEEYFNNSGTALLKSNLELKIDKKTRITIPFFFEFHTFLIDSTGFDVDFCHNYEFSEVRWFSIGSLPEKTHFGVKYSLAMFKLH